MTSRVASPVIIGRHQELLVLETACAGSARGDGAVTVLVGGDAGIGKSRLLDAFGERARAGGAIVLEGACISLGSDEGLPFAPIAEALRNLRRDLGAEALATYLDAATSELASLVPELGAVSDEMLPGGRPDWAQTRVFEGVLTLLGRLGERAPVVLTIEDLHWADRSTRDLIAFLSRSLRAERVTVVATYRTDELHRRHPLRQWLVEMDRSPQVTRLELAPLGRDETRDQLAAILGHDPDAVLLGSIVERAGGNPFFAEELLAAGVTGENDHLPESLRDVLLVRVHALSDRSQDVLGCAAVAGGSFDHELLAEASGFDEAVLSAGLREAVAAQLLIPDANGAAYTFRHALVQEAVYDDLLPSDRRRDHARYAAALGRRPVPDGALGASQLAALAHHASAAHDLPLALRGWFDAARASARVYALAEAAHAYERVLDLWDAVPEDARPAGIDIVSVMYDATLSLIGAGQLQRAREVAGNAVARHEVGEDPLRAAILRERYARTLWLNGDLRSSLDVLDEAVRLCEGRATPESARVVASLAGMLVLRDHTTRAIEVGRQAVALAREVGARQVEAYAICGLGVALVNRGDCAEGLALLREANSLAHELQLSAIDFHRTYANLSTGLQICGLLDESVAVALEGVDWARRRGLWRLQGAFLEANAAAALVDLGRWDEAQALLDQRSRPIVEGVARLNHAVVAGPLAVRTGRLAEAREILEPAYARLVGLGDAQFTGPISVGMVELAIADGRYEDAARRVDQAIDWMGEAEETGTRNRVECLALGLRAAALAIDAARSRRDAVEETALRARAAGHIGAVRRFADGPLGPLSGAGGEIRGYVAMAEAEYRAIAGEPDPDAWAAAVAIWRELGRPWPLATALSREAEAILAARRSRVDAAAPLAESLAIAGELGAAPLAAWCLSLARMGRVELPDQPTSGDGAGAAEAPIAASSDGSVSTPSAAAFGLTPRELDVLRLLAEGYSNREIGGTLYISESTAGVHVSNILGKLGVSGRVEAAAVAVRSGLVD